MLQVHNPDALIRLSSECITGAVMARHNYLRSPTSVGVDERDSLYLEKSIAKCRKGQKSPHTIMTSYLNTPKNNA